MGRKLFPFILFSVENHIKSDVKILPGNIFKITQPSLTTCVVPTNHTTVPAITTANKKETELPTSGTLNACVSLGVKRRIVRKHRNDKKGNSVANEFCM